MDRRIICRAIVLLCLPTLSTSFVPRRTGQSLTTISRPSGRWTAPYPSMSQLLAKTSDDNSNIEDQQWKDTGSWTLLNDFPTFLNQVSVQSLIFLVNSLRDRHTAIWLEDFTQPVIRSRTKDKASDHVLSNMAKALQDAMHETQTEREIQLLKYHGLAAINTTLFPTWDSFFEQLLQQPSVTYVIESSRPHVPTYEMEINPASLCSRLISVREQIALEFVNDLDVIAELSSTMMQRYFDSNGKGDGGGGGGGSGVMEPLNLLFLETSVDSDFTPSPLRKGNFDLLMTLTTQEAIHRVLNKSNKSNSPTSDQSSLQFLQNFYVNRIHTHFTGSNWYGRAEDFLIELLQSSPSIIQVSEEESNLVDPLRVADLVLQQREQVAEEWLELALDVPQAHTNIKRWQFNRLMGRAIDERMEYGFD